MQPATIQSIAALLAASKRQQHQATRKATSRQRTLDRRRARLGVESISEATALLQILSGRAGAGARGAGTGQSKRDNQAARGAAKEVAAKRHTATMRRASQHWATRNDGAVSDTSGQRGRGVTTPHALARVEDGGRGHVFADSPADAARMASGFAAPLAIRYATLFDLDATLGRTLAKLGKSAARGAARSIGRVSVTSLDEAAAEGRAAVLARLSPGGVFNARLAARLVRGTESDTLASEIANRVAVRAGTKSLMGDLTAGQTGRTEGLRGLRREAVAVLDSIVRGGTDDDGELTERSRARALDLVLAVRRAMRARLGEAPRSPGWQARLKLLIRRFRRVATVLSLVAQGDSLEVACEAAGFGWQASYNRSMAFNAALDQTGVRALLCSRAGLGTVGQSKPVTV